MRGFRFIGRRSDAGWASPAKENLVCFKNVRAKLRKDFIVIRCYLVVIFSLLSCVTWAQLTAEQTGVSSEALQHDFEDYMSFSSSHGQLCQKTLRQARPTVNGSPIDGDISLNVAGIITSTWSQDVARPDGKLDRWRFECVSQIRAGRKLFVSALVMYEQRGAERRGVELLTNRDVRIVHKPK